MLRFLILGSHFMIFLSSLIVTALLSYFIHTNSFRGAHLIYQEVIATVTLAIYLFGMLLPLIDSYRGYLMPMNLILSYLWLTSFIFTAQDWGGGRCIFSPPNFGECRKKHAAEAFTFLAFFFLICNTVAEGYLLRTHGSNKGLTKERTDRAADNSANVV
ncbi:hypothetical protein CDD83_9129 [Cordyceps sp. RAO-2017]|nr:hypothetical protein CDD83_9129 [Cordyceps sp. RAO-2017]